MNISVFVPDTSVLAAARKATVDYLELLSIYLYPAFHIPSSLPCHMPLLCIRVEHIVVFSCSWSSASVPSHQIGVFLTAEVVETSAVYYVGEVLQGFLQDVYEEAIEQCR